MTEGAKNRLLAPFAAWKQNGGKKMANKTTPEKHFELIERGYIKPTTRHVNLVMPSTYRTVPTGLMYDVPEPPIQTDVPEPQLEEDASERQNRRRYVLNARRHSQPISQDEFAPLNVLNSDSGHRNRGEPGR